MKVYNVHPAGQRARVWCTHPIWGGDGLDDGPQNGGLAPALEHQADSALAHPGVCQQSCPLFTQSGLHEPV